MSTPTVTNEINDEKPVFELFTNFRRIGIYSENSQHNMVLAVYKDENNIKRIMLDSVDLPLAEFSSYLECLTGKEDRIDELTYVGLQASCATGVIMCFILIITIVFNL
jgi:hypothetical protein